jgi:hypothetical protein
VGIHAIGGMAGVGKTLSGAEDTRLMVMASSAKTNGGG